MIIVLVPYSGGSVRRTADGTDIAAVADVDALKHDVADGGIGGSREQRLCNIADYGISTVVIGLRGQSAGECRNTGGTAGYILGYDVTTICIGNLAQRRNIGLG